MHAAHSYDLETVLLAFLVGSMLTGAVLVYATRRQFTWMVEVTNELTHERNRVKALRAELELDPTDEEADDAASITTYHPPHA